jgi:hypothetical protein
MSLLGILVAAAVGMFVYQSYFTAPESNGMGGGSPRATADIVGVKNDLMQIAQAQRAHRALTGSYATLEELRASGTLLIDPRRTREGYSYSTEVTESGFRVTANYSGPAEGMPTLFVDETMQIQQR